MTSFALNWHECVLIRYTFWRILDFMATLNQKIEAEHRMRELLEDNGLPQPDAVEYGYTCVRLFWEKTKHVVIIDIDEPSEGFELVGEQLVDEDDAA